MSTKYNINNVSSSYLHQIFINIRDGISVKPIYRHFLKYRLLVKVRTIKYWLRVCRYGFFADMPILVIADMPILPIFSLDDFIYNWKKCRYADIADADINIGTPLILAISCLLWPNIGSEYRLYFGDISPRYHQGTIYRQFLEYRLTVLVKPRTKKISYQ